MPRSQFLLRSVRHTFTVMAILSVILIFYAGYNRAAAPAREPLDATRRSRLPSADILYARYTPNRTEWQLCLLSLPTCKVKILTGSRENRSLGRLAGIDTTFSTNGRRILLTASAPGSRAETAARYSMGTGELLDLWILEGYTGKLKRLTSDNQGYSSLKWSPNARYVSALGYRGRTTPEVPLTEAGAMHTDLYAWDSETGRRLSIIRNVQTYQWMPNSRGLLALRNDWSLYTWDVQTRKKELISKDVSTANWMPDSKGLLLKRNDTGLFFAPLYGEPVPFEESIGNIYAPAWSPAASQLAFMDGSTSHGHLEWNLRVLSLASREVRTLREQGGPPTWSPDGRIIAATVTVQTPDNKPYATDLYAVDTSTGKSRKLRTFPYDARVLAWPDDNTIILLNTQYERKLKDGHVVELLNKPQRLLVVSAESGKIREAVTLPRSREYSETLFMDWRLREKMRREPHH